MKRLPAGWCPEINEILLRHNFDRRYLEFARDRLRPDVAPRLPHTLVHSVFEDTGMDFEHDRLDHQLYHSEEYGNYGFSVVVELEKCDRGIPFTWVVPRRSKGGGDSLKGIGSGTIWGMALRTAEIRSGESIEKRSIPLYAFSNEEELAECAKFIVSLVNDVKEPILAYLKKEFGTPGEAKE